MMEELLNSVIRFSAALTAFGIHQMQLVMTAPGQSLKSFAQIREAMDSAAQVLAENVDEQQKHVFSSLVGVSSGMVARTAGMVDASLLDPNRIVQTATDIAQKATDSVLGTGSRKKAAGRW